MNISKHLYIDNLGIGLLSTSNYDNLDLTNDEYLVMGQKDINDNTLDIPYSLIVNNKGLSVNSTRNIVNNEISNTGCLYVGTDIICKGKIITESIQLQNVILNSNITNEYLTELIKTLNNNHLIFNGYNNGVNSNILPEFYRDNIYTPSYFTIGSKYNTHLNNYPINIVNNSLNNVSNIHICMRNSKSNNIETSKFRLGIIGNLDTSPATITTTENMPLEFHISKSSSFLKEIYDVNNDGLPSYTTSNLPCMIITTEGNVGINTNIINTISQINEKPKLYVNGTTVTQKLLIYEPNTNIYKDIDDIYIKSYGYTLNINQLIGNTFNKDIFTFTSNVNISNILNVYEDLNVEKITNLNTLNVNKISEFNDIVLFNDITTFNNKLNLNDDLNLSSGNLFIDGVRINVNSNLSYAVNGLNIDNSNLTISGRLGVGILNTDSYNNQLTVIKRNTSKFEILLKDYRNEISDSYETYIGHTSNLNFIEDKDDNSFMIFTQKCVNWHNIYFFAGKDMNTSIPNVKNKIPTMAIMQNDRVGINTNKPSKTLEVVGDILGNNYFTKDINNNIYQLTPIINNNISNLNINISDINNFNNTKILNISGGINSYNGYYENNYKISNFYSYDETSINVYNNKKLGIGFETNKNLIMPLEIRNNNVNSQYSNSIIRIYRGKSGSNNNALYSGIDICDYEMDETLIPEKFKWYIYKKHIDNLAYNHIGPLQIGYTFDSYEPIKNAINLYYNINSSNYHIDINKTEVNYNYNNDVALSVYGDLEVYGNINIISTNYNKYYKYNNEKIVLSNINNELNVPFDNNIYDCINQFNDISMTGNNITLLTEKSCFIGNYNDLITSNFILNYHNNINTLKSSLNIFQSDNKNSVCKFYSNYSNITSNNLYNNNIIDFSIIDIENTIHNNVKIKLTGYDDNITIFEFIPKTDIEKPYISFYANNILTYTHIGRENIKFNLNSNLKYTDTVLHIEDSNDYLIRLTNNNFAPSIIFNSTEIIDTNLIDHKWRLTSGHVLNNYNFSLTYNSNLSDNIEFLKINNNGIFNMNYDTNINNYNYTYNLNNKYDSSSLLLTNRYNTTNSRIYPHITLQNYFKNNQITNKHNIYSSNGILDIYLDNNNIFSLDNLGTLVLKGGITVNDIILNGNLYDTNYNNLLSFQNNNLYKIQSSNIKLLGSNIVINPSCNGGGILINGESINDGYNNLFQINSGNTYNNGNLITLKSSNDLNFIHFFNNIKNNEIIKSVYRIGLNNDTFGIWNSLNTNDITNGGFIDGTSNTLSNYSKAIGLKYNNDTQNYNYELNGNIKIQNDLIIKNNSSNLITFYNNNISYDIKIENNLYVGGNVIATNLSVPSDRRIKTDIKPIENALDKINKLTGIIYKNIRTNNKESGLIAQDVLEVLPEVIIESNGYLNISYGNMIGLLVEGIKELNKKISNI